MQDLKNDQNQEQENPERNEPIRKDSTYEKINRLDWPNGDIEKAQLHGDANLLYKINSEKITNFLGNLKLINFYRIKLNHNICLEYYI